MTGVENPHAFVDASDEVTRLKGELAEARENLAEVHLVASTVTLKRHGCDPSALVESLCNVGDFDIIGAREASEMFARIASLAAPPPAESPPVQPTCDCHICEDGSMCFDRADAIKAMQPPQAESTPVQAPPPTCASGCERPVGNGGVYCPQHQVHEVMRAYRRPFSCRCRECEAAAIAPAPPDDIRERLAAVEREVEYLDARRNANERWTRNLDDKAADHERRLAALEAARTPERLYSDAIEAALRRDCNHPGVTSGAALEAKGEPGAVPDDVCSACRKTFANHVNETCDARQFVPMKAATP